MSSEAEKKKRRGGWKEKVGVLFRPKNMVRTLISAVPHVGHPVVEMQNQLEAHDLEKQVQDLGAADIALSAKVQELEKVTKPEPAAISEWPTAAWEFLHRTVDLLAVYNAGSQSPNEKGRELYKAVGHGCLIAENEVLTCREAWAFVQDIAAYHHGRVKIGVGLAWYECEAGPVDEGSGLLVIQLGRRDEQKWERSKKKLNAQDTQELMKGEVKASLTPWIGEEIAFIHSGQANNVGLAGLPSFNKRQFDTATISHFRRPADDGLKVFVTGALGGRILVAGAPTFNRKGTLLGIISDTENYRDDAGRRAVVRSLLIHPRFKHLLKTK